MLWNFFSMMHFTGSSSLNVMKQKPLLLFVLVSMGSSIDSTCSRWQYIWIIWQLSCGVCYISAQTSHKATLLNEWKHSKQTNIGTSPKAPKYSLTFSSGVSGERPPTKIFFTGSFPFMALAFLGSITFPLSLCSFCEATFITVRTDTSFRCHY